MVGGCCDGCVGGLWVVCVSKCVRLVGCDSVFVVGVSISHFGYIYIYVCV